MQLKEWKKTRETTLTLPSGLEVLVKKAGMLDVIAFEKNVPTPLLDLVSAMTNAGEVQFDASTLRNYEPVISTVARACILEPPLLENVPTQEIENWKTSGTYGEKSEEYLPFSLLDMTDRLYIFNWAQTEVAQVTSFPQTT